MKYDTVFWRYDPNKNDIFVESSLNEYPVSWYGQFDMKESIITAANQLIKEHKIIQELPVRIVSFSEKRMDEKILELLNKKFLSKTSGIKALPKIDFSKKYSSLKIDAITQIEDFLKMSQDNYLIEKILSLAPNWTKSLAAAFILWWGATGAGSEQIDNSIKNNPAETVQKIEQFKQIQQPTSQPTSQPVIIEDWIERIIMAESSGIPNKESPVGARGLMQIMPATWNEQTKKIYGKPLSFDLAFDPKINRTVGTHYLKEIQKTLKNWTHKEPSIEQILASYNGGMGRLRKNNFDVSKMPEETRNYVTKITQKQNVDSHKKHKKKGSKNTADRDWRHHIADTDRYNTDHYELLLSLREKSDEYSLGFQVLSAQVGISAFSEYWHFSKDESELAKDAFEKIRKVSEQLVSEIETKKLNFVLISPKFRFALKNIYKEHKEKTGVSFINTSIIDQDPEEDWRNSLYSGHYPDSNIENIRSFWSNKEQSKKIEEIGSARNKLIRYKYSQKLPKFLINEFGLNWGKIAKFLNESEFTPTEIAQINKQFLGYYFHLA